MSGSIDMNVLRALRNAAGHGVWVSLDEIGQAAGVPTKSVGSSIRRLRRDGFVINHVRRFGRVREYSLRKEVAR